MNNFKEEAERNPYTPTIHRNGINNPNSKYKIWNDGYQQGIEIGMRFAEWTRHQQEYYYVMDDRWWRTRKHSDKRFTTAELFEIFKKESSGKMTDIFNAKLKKEQP